jgi:hypothetical protein
VELERRLPPVERRGHVIARQLEQRRALQRRVAAAANDSSSPAPTSGEARSLSDGATTSDEPGRIRKISGHALARLLDRDGAGGDVAADSGCSSPRP